MQTAPVLRFLLLLIALPAAAEEPPPWRAGLELGAHVYRVPGGALSGADQRVANSVVVNLGLHRSVAPWLWAGAAVGVVPSEATPPSTGGVTAIYGRAGVRLEPLPGVLRPYGEAAVGLARYAAERSATTWLLSFGAGGLYEPEGWPVALVAGARWFGHGPDNGVRALPKARIFVSGELFLGVELPFGGGRAQVKEPGEPDEAAAPPPPPAAAPGEPIPAPEISVPLAFLAGGKVELIEPIVFAPGEATLEGSSHKVLEAVAGLMAENPGTLVIRVGGKKALAAKRGQAVEFFLLGLGVDPARLQSEPKAGAEGELELLLQP